MLKFECLNFKILSAAGDIFIHTRFQFFFIFKFLLRSDELNQFHHDFFAVSICIIIKPTTNHEKKRIDAARHPVALYGKSPKHP